MIIPSRDDITVAQIWALLQRERELAADELLDQIRDIIEARYAGLAPEDRSVCSVCSADIGEWCDDGRQPLLTVHPGRGERLDRPAAVLAAARVLAPPQT